MLDLERTLENHFPALFRGPRRRIARPLSRGLGRWMGIDVANEVLRRYGHLRGLSFVEAALRHFNCRYTVDDIEREHIPTSGRVIIASNHPLGGLDSLLLLKLAGDLRPDVRILANDILLQIEPLRDLLLPVRVLGGKATPASCKRILAELEADRAVIVFPAGEVSRLSPGGIRGRRWESGFLRFAAHAGAPVVPLHIKANNSAWFYAATSVAPPLGTLMLPREMFLRRGETRAEVRIDAPVCAPERQAGKALERSARALRKQVYGLTRKHRRDSDIGALPRPEDPRRLLAELDRSERIGATRDGKAMFLARLDTDSALLREIGRLREYTFRAVGEGTGRHRDLDAFDRYYEHLVLWDEEQLEIAGAYRLASCREILQTHGLKGLYTAGLFNYSPAMQAYLQEGLELGRSFVQPRYWGSRSLDYLWHGIGAYLNTRPGLRYLLGPVTISPQEPPAARDWLVAYYERYFGTDQALAQARQPFSYQEQEPDFGSLDADTSFKVLKENLKRLGSRVPTLYKQYTELCEPGGARFLAFGVDPEFSNSVDGLILVDLHRIRASKRARYLNATTTAARPAAAAME